MNPEHLSILSKGVDVWNQWRRDHPGVTPDLSSARLNSAGLSKVNLAGANLSSARLSFADLSLANLSGANLSNSNISSANLSFADLRSANLSSANLSFTSLQFADCGRASFSGANLSFADLSGGDLAHAVFSLADLSCSQLRGATLSESDLSRANLSGATLAGANLTAAQALTANLSQSVLTGAVIADWHVGKLTQLDGVQCDYLYCCCDPNTGEPAARLPVDPTQMFAPGEFEQRCQARNRPLTTVDLRFLEGIDWRAFFASFQQLRQQWPHNAIAIHGIEYQEEAFTICLQVSDGAHAAEIETCAKQLYQTHLMTLEQQYEKQIRSQGEPLETFRQAIAARRREKATLMEVLATLAHHQRPPQYDLEVVQALRWTCSESEHATYSTHQSD